MTIILCLVSAMIGATLGAMFVAALAVAKHAEPQPITARPASRGARHSALVVSPLAAQKRGKG